MKIFIIGNSGSGKTTLSKKLAEKKNLNPIDLDHDVVYEQTHGQKKRRLPPVKEAVTKIETICSKDNWVAEGLYLFRELLDASDTIIWLKIPLYVNLYRQWKRYITNPMQKKEHGFKSNLKLSKRIIKKHFGWYKREREHEAYYVNMQEVGEVLKKYQNKLRVVKNNKDLDTLIESL